MMVASSIDELLAAAVHEVNAAFARLPSKVQATLDPADCQGEREIDAAIISGDDDRARQAIRSWRSYWLARLEGAK